MAESAIRGRGEQLGPTGGRIVAEVLIGILEADRGSYRANSHAGRQRSPHPESAFGLTDLLPAADARDG